MRLLKEEMLTPPLTYREQLRNALNQENIDFNHVKYLILNKKAEYYSDDIASNTGWTAYHEAAKRGDVEFIEQRVGKIYCYTSFTVKDKFERSPLFYAKDLPTIEILLRFHHIMDHPDSEGRKPYLVLIEGKTSAEIAKISYLFLIAKLKTLSLFPPIQEEKIRSLNLENDVKFYLEKIGDQTLSEENYRHLVTHFSDDIDYLKQLMQRKEKDTLDWTYYLRSSHRMNLDMVALLLQADSEQVNRKSNKDSIFKSYQYLMSLSGSSGKQIRYNELFLNHQLKLKPSDRNYSLIFACLIRESATPGTTLTWFFYEKICKKHGQLFVDQVLKETGQKIPISKEQGNLLKDFQAEIRALTQTFFGSKFNSPKRKAILAYLNELNNSLSPDMPFTLPSLGVVSEMDAYRPKNSLFSNFFKERYLEKNGFSSETHKLRVQFEERLRKAHESYSHEFLMTGEIPQKIKMPDTP